MRHVWCASRLGIFVPSGRWPALRSCPGSGGPVGPVTRHPHLEEELAMRRKDRDPLIAGLLRADVVALRYRAMARGERR